VNPEGGGYLKDNTGARRFWPVALGKVNIKGLARERKQLWAEAVARYKAKEQWWLNDDALIVKAAEVAEERRQVHPWEPAVTRWLLDRTESRIRTGVTTYEVLVEALDIPARDQHIGESMQVAAILQRCGWGPMPRKRVGGIPTRLYGPVDLDAFLKLRATVQAERTAAREMKQKQSKGETVKQLKNLLEQVGTGWNGSQAENKANID
jgi:predicted P-loop ATPase